MHFIFVLLILGVSKALCVQNISAYSTGTFQESQTNRTSRTFNPNGKVEESSYRSDDDDQMHHQNVLESLNSKIPEVPISLLGSQQRQVLSQQKTPSYQQPTDFKSPPSFSFTNSESSKVNYYSPSGYNQQEQRDASGAKVFPVQGSLLNAQRRTDEDVDEEYAPEANYPQDSYASGSDKRGNSEQPGHNQFEQQPRQPDLEKPETRQGFFPEFPVSGPGFVGPAAFDPLPPPPPPIKGSVDYILIPLILIGLAGPIFVVLYVILGAFEAKLSPITRSLGGMGSVQPYLDTLISSVGRALDKSDCWEYSACQVGNFCNTLGYTEDLPLKRALETSVPGKYKRSLRKLFTAMKERRDCQLRSCLSF